MKLTHWASKTSLVLLFMSQCSASAVSAEMIEQALLDQYPAGSINAVAFARTALTEVEVVRGAVEQRFAESRAVCMNKFFMSHCVAEAKEIRRAALHSIRKIEVEANAFLRKDRAAERERTIAERQSRAARPLGAPSIPISGAARDSGNPTPDSAANPPAQTEKPEKP
jgi:hypothetical protein